MVDARAEARSAALIRIPRELMRMNVSRTRSKSGDDIIMTGTGYASSRSRQSSIFLSFVVLRLRNRRFQLGDRISATEMYWPSTGLR